MSLQDSALKSPTQLSSSPNLHNSPSSKKMDQKDWQQRSLISGTSVEKIRQAMNTFENEVGPG